MSGNSQAQQWDYELHPPANVELTHLDAELKIESDGRIQGDLVYTAAFKNSFADSVFFDAAGLDIQTVTINGNEVEFLIEDLRLIILPDRQYQRNEEVEIGISYMANPKFGTHISDAGSIRTSLLPRSTQHWLSIVDNPGVLLSVDFTITHPAGTVIAANGRKGISEVVDTGYERTTFNSDSPVSASSLGWALFEEAQSASTSTSDEIRNSYNSFSRRSGAQITVYSEIEADTDEILLWAADIFHDLSTEMEIGFPYGDLQLIVLQNDFMETKQTGDGILFVYENKGDLKRQIEEGIVSMFAETVLRAPAWSDSDAALITKAALLNQLGVETEYDKEEYPGPYDVYSSGFVALWQHFLMQDAPDAFLEGMDILFNQASETGTIVAGWNEFSEILYNETGRAWFDGFELTEPEMVSEDTTITYTAIIDREEGSTSAEIRFEAESIAVEELVTVDAEVIGLSETQVRELSFTGASDGVVLNVPSTLENIKLTVREREDVYLQIQKPFQFWMYQLLNDEDDLRRAEAASGITAYSDNPDIELLLNDVLRSEESDLVTSEVLRAMAEITGGASGTHERFLQYTGSQHADVVRLAAIESLSMYDGNERVLSRLQSIVVEETDDTILNSALRSISEIVEPSRYADIIASLISRDAIPDKIPFVLEILADKGAGERSAELADQALGMDLPYQVMQGVIHFLMEVDKSPENWENRLPELLEHPHPGVRISAAEATKILSEGQRESLTEMVLPNEFDERVRHVLRGE